MCPDNRNGCLLTTERNKPLQTHEKIVVSSWSICECTENVRKEKYVCTILAVLITLYVNPQLNGFHDHRIYEYTGKVFGM